LNCFYVVAEFLRRQDYGLKQWKTKTHINEIDNQTSGYNAISAAVLFKTAKIEGNYGALLFAKLYTVISHNGRSFEEKKLTNAHIFMFYLNFVRTENTYNINPSKRNLLGIKPPCNPPKCRLCGTKIVQSTST